MFRVLCQKTWLLGWTFACLSRSINWGRMNLQLSGIGEEPEPEVSLELIVLG